MHCLKCGKLIENDAKFCGNCGVKIIAIKKQLPTTLRCLNCGKQNKPEDEFCARCGVELLVVEEKNHRDDIINWKFVEKVIVIIASLTFLLLFIFSNSKEKNLIWLIISTVIPLFTPIIVFFILKKFEDNFSRDQAEIIKLKKFMRQPNFFDKLRLFWGLKLISFIVFWLGFAILLPIVSNIVAEHFEITFSRYFVLIIFSLGFFCAMGVAFLFTELLIVYGLVRFFSEKMGNILMRYYFGIFTYAYYLENSPWLLALDLKSGVVYQKTGFFLMIGLSYLYFLLMLTLFLAGWYF